MKYTIYNTTTGEILRVVICNAPDEQLAEGESYIEGGYADTEYQIISGEPVVKPTPAFDAVAASLTIRIKRNKLLLSSDYTQLPDSTEYKAAWVVYRQELRDITKQSTFPENVVWPIAPH